MRKLNYIFLYKKGACRERVNFTHLIERYTKRSYAYKKNFFFFKKYNTNSTSRIKPFVFFYVYYVLHFTTSLCKNWCFFKQCTP